MHRSAAPTIGSIFAPDPKHELPFGLGMGLVNTPFAIPNIRAENPEAPAHVRIGWFRAVSNIPHAFAIQDHVAKLSERRFESIHGKAVKQRNVVRKALRDHRADMPEGGRAALGKRRGHPDRAD